MKGIRKIVDKHKMRYIRYNILQPSEMKTELDKLKIKEAQHGVSIKEAKNNVPIY